MELRLKLELKEDLKEELIKIVDDGERCITKLTANVLRVEKDNKDERYIKSLRNVKMIISLDEGCLILFGHLQCSFKAPYGGAFYVYKIVEDPTSDFKGTLGVEANVTFTNNPITIDEMRNYLEIIKSDERFVFNISQFDDFMYIFEYYKLLSDELNNSASYEIISKSKPYYYIPVSAKELFGQEGELLDEYKSLEVIKDSDEIDKGYVIEEYMYELMSNSSRDKVKELVDIEVAKKDNKFRKLQKMYEDMYLSNYREINHRTLRDLKHLSVINLFKLKSSIMITVELEDKMDYKYLNLYDMGQKIKVDSIDNSLRLIKQGNSGSAIELISYLIGDATMPNTQKVLTSKEKKYTSDLNDSQKSAFLKAIDGSPITLIKGPPGTGKTHVINAITQYLTKEVGEKVVISSQTHVAIDNVLDKLMENHDLVVPNRITNRKNKYSGNEIDRTLYKTWGTNFEKHNKLATNKTMAKSIREDIKNFKGEERFKFSENTDISDFSVLGATTTTSAIAGKKGIELLKEYKWLIIDEVSKCPITEVLRYLPYIEKIIMVGDDYQLAPLLEFTKDQVKDLDVYDEDKFDLLAEIYQKSVFADTMDKARKADRLVELDINYRSVPNVLNAYNIFYNFSLKSMRLEVNPNKVQFTEKMDYLNENDIMFVYVKGGKEITDDRTRSRYNVEELNATKNVLKNLIESTVNPANVSVSAIFPYSAQISRFTRKNRDLINRAKKIFKNFDVDTVDAFQGKESDIVLVNTVITERNKRNFLSDFRRINVSMSRAKDKLIIFGNLNVLAALDMNVYDGTKRKYFKEIIADIRRKGLMMQYTEGGGVQIESTSKAKAKIKKTK